MKRILLASTAIVAFAGAAAAEVTFDGDAEFGWNDDFDDGFFWEVGATLGFSMDLDNGLTASVAGDVEFVSSPNTDEDDPDDPTDDANADSTFADNDIEIDDIVITLASDTASLAFGDTAPAADALWSSPVTNLDADDFNDEDDLDDEDGIIIGQVSFGEIDFGISYGVVDSNGGDESDVNDGSDDDLIGLQAAVNATVGTFDLSFAYQESVDGQTTTLGSGDEVTVGSTPEIFAFGVGTTLAGIELGLAYAMLTVEDEDSSDEAEVTSLGVQGAYTVGPVTLGAFYVSQDIDDDIADGDIDDNYGVFADYAAGPVTVGFLYHDGQDEDLQLNATYALESLGIDLFAGYRDEGENGDDEEQAEIFYIGGDYDLGGGATLRISYADVDEGEGGVDSDLDELGAAEDVKEGATIALSFVF
ncbi:MAG: porin [Pseudomonadota bacterium]